MQKQVACLRVTWNFSHCFSLLYREWLHEFYLQVCYFLFFLFTWIYFYIFLSIKDEVACADPAECMKYCESPNGCSNLAYPRMVIDLLPSGARGLMLAVMMSALMSSLTSIFNSSSTIFSMDIWKRIRKDAKDWELMIIGKLTVLVLVVISILWIPIIKASQGLLHH